MSQPAELLTIESASETDALIVSRLRAGDRDALATLFRRHVRDLVRLAAGIMGSAEDGQDVVQDVFVGLELALRRYEERGEFGAWLRGVTVRTALAARRKSTRRRETVPEALELLRDRSALADSVTLGCAVEALAPALREVFLLKIVAGYTHAEIGQLLGIRSNTSEVRLFRALRHLRTLLSDAP